ncbi:MAG: hypothetical protein M3410_15550, partial [Acidobacteriota bacterium]|nr:hypothetical protein [Acidobacteriota bacterium]
METATRIRNFADDLLQREGALVEPLGTHCLHVLSPTHVQQALGVSDLERLGFGSDAPAGTHLVNLESDWLERFSKLLCQRGTSARCVLRVPAPAPAAPERIVAHTLNLQNAVYDITRVSSAWTRYHILLFHYTAYSDEERDGLLKLGVNNVNGAVLEETTTQDLLNVALAQEGQASAFTPEAQLPPAWDEDRLSRWARRALPERVQAHLAPFVNGLQRRLDRDLARVRGYYGDLQTESSLRLRKRQLAKDRLRLEAIEREYHAKVEDLRQKYRVRVELVLNQTLELIMPVQRFELLIKRRKAKRQVLLDWNPLLRKLDTPP